MKLLIVELEWVNIFKDERRNIIWGKQLTLAKLGKMNVLFQSQISAPTKFTLPETGGSKLQYPGYIPQTGLRLSLSIYPVIRVGIRG